MILNRILLNTKNWKQKTKGLNSYQVHTLPPKSLPIPISVYVIKHAFYSELWEGQGEGQNPCKLGAFLTKL